MGILSNGRIAEAMAAGDIRIVPFEPVNLGPCSYDLKLGLEVLTYAVTQGSNVPPGILDSAREIPTTRHVYEVGAPILLRPGMLYLMHTLETVYARNYVPDVDGKSSIGRLGATAHVTAGRGDPGFEGQYTLEVCVVHPTIVYAGMRFAQVFFHTLELTEHEWHAGAPDYKRQGNYVGDLATGPVASRAWKQLKDDGLIKSVEEK